MFFFVFYYIHSLFVFFFFFSSRRRHTRYWRDWSSDVCSSDLTDAVGAQVPGRGRGEPGGDLDVRPGVPGAAQGAVRQDPRLQRAFADAEVHRVVALVVADREHRVVRALEQAEFTGGGAEAEAGGIGELRVLGRARPGPGRVLAAAEQRDVAAGAHQHRARVRLDKCP